MRDRIARALAEWWSFENEADRWFAWFNVAAILALAITVLR